MTKAEELYHSIAADIPDTTKSKMFGALCLKAPNGKAGVMFWKEYMVFKLPDTEQAEALQLKNAKMFTPMDGRAMNGWVQLSEAHSAKWKQLAETSMEHVKKIEVKSKKAKK
ncbi:hypothetical protein CJD36_006445 [Flavipsychrobacter stenotrophus]|uniref:TfoX N-terminal domain-containing protein n=1 Tax=Flavipsychrobacter stenotrophus TaxID=2077091 RepID=A0A2S7SXU4_9BACT|nr:hypothetical protein [Flavipsychrobacter stenotrophus]PQJ11437.1 hypothetical protein CJD36_006445 [Flavipsychrobacter stenotrophus]